MIRDRGNIKWVSMILPEHVKLLRQWAKEDLYEKNREIDEQYLEMMNEILVEAMEFGKEVEITYFQKHHYESVTGKIQHYDEIKQQLHIVDQFEQKHAISLSAIVDVKLV